MSRLIRRAAGFVLAVAIGLCCASGLASPRIRGEFFEMESGRVLLVSNGNREQCRALLEQLAHFRVAIAALLPRVKPEPERRTRIYVFRRSSTFEHYSRLLGAPRRIDGFFVATPSSNNIVIHERGLADSPGLIYHESLHQIVSESAPGLPLWLNEGLAEYVSSFWSDEREAELGLAQPDYLYRVREERSLALDALLDIAPRSADYREPGRKSLFHARSWALVHFLVSTVPSFKRAVPLYLEQLGDGVDQERAFGHAFGIAPARVEPQVLAHLGREPLPSLRVSLSDTATPAIETRSIGDAGALYRLGELLAEAGRKDEAEEHFRGAAGSEPNSKPALISLARLLVRSGRGSEADPILASLEGLAPDDPEVHRLRGERLLQPFRSELRSGLPERTTCPADVRAARRAFERAIELEPDAVSAWTGAAAACLFEPSGSGQDDSCRSLFARGRQRFPGDGELACRHALFLARRGDTAAVTARLEEARLSSPNDAWITWCREHLP